MWGRITVHIGLYIGLGLAYYLAKHGPMHFGAGHPEKHFRTLVLLNGSRLKAIVTKIESLALASMPRDDPPASSTASNAW